MNTSSEERCRVWLKSADGIGAAHFYRLIAEYGSAQLIWDNLSDLLPELEAMLSAKTIQQLTATHDVSRLDAFFERIDSQGIRAITTLSDEYPEMLSDIYDPPPVLFLRGTAPVNYDRRFAVVGSRRATYDGRRTAREFSELLSENGVSVVSGMASGIDSEAHKGALAGKTHTIAVLGCGADVVYPAENQKLYDQIIAEGGLIVSEYMPGTPPLKKNFPLRNRLISGMSSGTLLVEGMVNSGAMITVNYALDQGRDVFAVPGSIYAPLSAAPLQIIKEGAIPVTCANDILSHFGWGEQAVVGRKRIEISLNDNEKRVVEALLDESLTFDQLIIATALPASELNTLLTMLELRSILHRLPGGQFALNA